jgi:osmotically-inducible protein OsmY
MLRSDAVLERDVAAELACDGACKSANIAIAVNNGIVTLSGTVSDRALQLAAVRAVKRVFGVEGINARLEVAPAVPQPATTATIGSSSSF